MAEQDAGGGFTKPTKLPGGYEPAIKCGDLGAECNDQEPCGGKLTCVGGLCLPDVRADNVESCGEQACPARAPLCVRSVCLTLDQLACSCLEPYGQRSILGCAGLVPADASTQSCLSVDSLCDSTPDACCDGLTCMRGQDDQGRQLLGLCKQACTNDDECETACCGASTAVASTFCAERPFCVTSCREQDEECDSNRNPCCDGLVCATSTTDPQLSGCQIGCAKNTECDTGCCVLFQAADGGTRDDGICAPSDRCAGQ